MPLPRLKNPNGPKATRLARSGSFTSSGSKYSSLIRIMNHYVHEQKLQLLSCLTDERGGWVRCVRAILTIVVRSHPMVVGEDLGNQNEWQVTYGSGTTEKEHARTNRANFCLMWFNAPRKQQKVFHWLGRRPLIGCIEPITSTSTTGLQAEWSVA